MKARNGFTLIELLVTLAVAAIVLVAAAPSFTTFIQNNRMSVGLNQMVISLNQARSRAVTERNNLTLCATTDFSACNTNDWERGWMMFEDDANLGTYNSGEEIVLTHDGLSVGLTLRASAATPGVWTYAADGTANQSGHFTLCDSRGAPMARAVEIAATGRIATVNADADSNGVLDVGGVNLSCP